MPLHGILGYIAVGLAGLGFILALGAWRGLSEPISRCMFLCFVLCMLAQVPTIAMGVIDNVAYAATAARVAPFKFFFAASFFTLTCMLAAWRWLNPAVLWDRDKWLIYQTAAVGNVLLGAALIGLGRQALIATR